jgi:hypothetical protein
MTKTISYSASSGTHQGDRESPQDRVCLFRNTREPIALEAHLVIGLTAIASTDQPHTIYASFLITSEGACHWAHVGDHSYVQSLVDRQEITPDQAINHPQANILTQCLGSKALPKIVHQSISQLREPEANDVATIDQLPSLNTTDLGFQLLG